ncbi:hypothetical protein BLNAU_1772 [Blattamonas nauphoetae]|uniref:Uncharacterized protein n=1 Tax=Blattamonas nauphoetae TaxID=2049346 RepID=A0ABQ9YHL7_9EUKA|nr:hypothetical protein BLNAU_1772 [Blattamonas nauphoetae]
MEVFDALLSARGGAQMGSQITQTPLSTLRSTPSSSNYQSSSSNPGARAQHGSYSNPLNTPSTTQSSIGDDGERRLRS